MSQPADQRGQLEFFDVANQPLPGRRVQYWGGILIQLRSDHLILWSIAALLLVTVIFASGVERGKQLARAERALSSPTLAQHAEVETPRGSHTAEAHETAAPKERQTTVTESPAAEKKLTPVPNATPSKVSKPTKLARAVSATSAGRYAVQVVTFTQPQLAKRELARLQSRGEPAFLMIREGRTSVYIGPFPSKAHAVAKRSHVKTTYQDCFVKTL